MNVPPPTPTRAGLEALARARRALADQQFAEAATQAQQTLMQMPDDFDALAIFAHALLGLGQLDESITVFETVHERAPGHPQVRAALAIAHHKRATRAHRAGELAIAQAGYDRAIDLAPDHADALYNRAKLAIGARHDALALPDLRRLATLRPDDDAVAMLLAETRVATGDEGAVAAIHQSLARPGRSVAERLRLARALADGADIAGALGEVDALRDVASFGAGLAVAQRIAENGDGVAARRAYASLAALGGDGAVAPTLVARLGASLALPSVYSGAAHLAQERAAFVAGVDDVTRALDDAALARCAPSLAQLQWTNQLVAFQGDDDREPLARYGDWLARAAAQFAPALGERPARGTHKRPRVGLVSSAFCHSSTGAYFGAWIGAIAEAGFDTRVYQMGPPYDQDTTALGRGADALVRLDGDLDAIATRLRDEQLDLVIYPDLGADPRILVLGALPLAQRQASAWGLPNTTGLPTIDAFFSCESMEPDDAAAHYREPLALLPGIGTRYRRPTTLAPVPREALGLPPGRLYLVPQMPAKLHPVLDAVCARIAQLDDDARLVFFAGAAPGATRALLRRVQSAMVAAGVDPSNRIVLLQPVKRSRFLQIAMVCDVLVDTHHWSGGNTTIDALICGLPVVAWPGARMRGRQSLAMLRQLGLEGELVRHDGDAQARRAVEIARDPALRRALSERISTGLPQLLDQEAPLHALIRHVRDLVGR